MSTTVLVASSSEGLVAFAVWVLYCGRRQRERVARAPTWARARRMLRFTP